MNDEEKGRLGALAGAVGMSRQRYLQEVICSGTPPTVTEAKARVAEWRASRHALEKVAAALAEAAASARTEAASVESLSPLLREATTAAARLEAALGAGGDPW